jgi:hypothetical protein
LTGCKKRNILKNKTLCCDFIIQNSHIVDYDFTGKLLNQPTLTHNFLPNKLNFQTDVFLSSPLSLPHFEQKQYYLFVISELPDGLSFF